MSSRELIYFNVILPALIVVVVLVGGLLHKRSLRKCDQASPSKEAAMTLADRVAELEAIIAAILAGATGWPIGLWDSPLKRVEAAIDALLMTDEELTEMAPRYHDAHGMPLGPTGAALLIEVARRSTLTAHARISEATERGRIRGC